MLAGKSAFEVLSSIQGPNEASATSRFWFYLVRFFALCAKKENFHCILILLKNFQVQFYFFFWNWLDGMFLSLPNLQFRTHDVVMNPCSRTGCCLFIYLARKDSALFNGVKLVHIAIPLGNRIEACMKFPSDYFPSVPKSERAKLNLCIA